MSKIMIYTQKIIIDEWVSITNSYTFGPIEYSLSITEITSDSVLIFWPIMKWRIIFDDNNDNNQSYDNESGDYDCDGDNKYVKV